MRFATTLMALVLLFGAGGAQAQTWAELSPEQQQTLEKFHEHWDSLPALRKEQLLHGAARYNELTPEQKQALQERRRRLQDMTPEERERLRQYRQQFRELPPERRAEIRERFKALRGLPDEQRKAIRECARGKSPEQAAACLPPKQ